MGGRLGLGEMVDDETRWDVDKHGIITKPARRTLDALFLSGHNTTEKDAT